MQETKIVIVESPAKAKTIQNYLAKIGNFTVRASLGHVLDLPQKELGVDLETMRPNYVTIPNKQKVVLDLRKIAETATEIYIAPDPDREGAVRAWHFKNFIFKNFKGNIFRVKFNE